MKPLNLINQSTNKLFNILVGDCASGKDEIYSFPGAATEILVDDTCKEGNNE